MTDDREPLGRVVRETWVAWAKEQPDVAEHPSWTEPYDRIPARDREVDMRIGSAVAAEALRQYEAEREALTLARLSRSVKLARIAALCRKSRCSDEGCEGHLIPAADILAIIGGDGQPAPEEPAP